MKKTIYKIKITNWKKYNTGKRENYKKIMVSQRFLDDAKIMSVTPVTRLLFLSCMLASCESDEGQCEVSHKSLVSQSGVKSESLQSKLDQLQSLQLLSYEILPPLITNRIEKKRKEINTLMPDPVESGDSSLPIVEQKLIDEPSQQKFDFEPLYTNYPRKEGKSRGFTLLKRQIKSPEDYEKLSVAINNYRKRCEEKRVEPKYIKHFATFVNEWRDWIDENHGATESFATPTGRRSWA